MLMRAANVLMWIRAAAILGLIPALIAWKGFDVAFAQEITSVLFVVMIVLTPVSFWFRHKLKKERAERHRSVAQQSRDSERR